MKKVSKIWICSFEILGVLLVLITSCKKDNEDNTVKDKDGNVYHTITIGTQVWMLENLKTTRYNDGSAIPLVTDATAWANLTTPGFCWYNNEEDHYKTPYGALYNWYAINTGKICPAGWHVPSHTEWATLITYLGGETVAGGKLKETGTAHWQSPNSATNETGFTAVPAGYRYFDGTFNLLGSFGYWWSSTENGTNEAWSRYIYYEFSNIYQFNYSSMSYGMSVRCVRD